MGVRGFCDLCTKDWRGKDIVGTRAQWNYGWSGAARQERGCRLPSGAQIVVQRLSESPGLEGREHAALLRCSLWSAISQVMADAEGTKRQSASLIGDTHLNCWPSLIQRPLQKVLELGGGVELVLNALLCEKCGQLSAHALWITSLALNFICRAPLIVCLINLQLFALPRNHFADVLEST
jgi:hypothetical protein